MQVQKLSSTDAFVLRDLGAGPLAIGIVRCAPKILVDGATWLARSVTYACAAFEIEAGGASAGVNAKPEDRDAAVAAFDAEAAAGAADAPLALDAGKGISAAELPALSALHPGAGDRHDAAPHLLTAGVVGAAGAALGAGEGLSFAVEGIDAMPSPLATAMVEAIAARGGRITALSTGTGSVRAADGIAAGDLAAALAAGDFSAVLGDAPAAANRLFGAEADVLLVGSKAGVLDHNGAGFVQARAVVPWGPVPFTAKALAVLGRAGVVAVPDFLATAGPLLGWAGGQPVGADADAAADRIAAVVAGVAGHEHGLFLGACLRAEAFLASWADQRPFGRPLA